MAPPEVPSGGWQPHDRGVTPQAGRHGAPNVTLNLSPRRIDRQKALMTPRTSDSVRHGPARAIHRKRGRSLWAMGGEGLEPPTSGM